MRWYGIDAVKEFAKSETSTVVITGGDKGLPMIGTIPMKSFTEIVPAPPPDEKEKDEKDKTEEPTQNADVPQPAGARP